MSKDGVENSFRPLLLGLLLDFEKLAGAREGNTVADVRPQVKPGAGIVATARSTGSGLRRHDEGAVRSEAVPTSATDEVLIFLHFLLWTTGTSRWDISRRRICIGRGRICIGRGRRIS